MGWNVPFLKRNCFHIQLKCHQQIEMSAFDESISQTIRIKLLIEVVYWFWFRFSNLIEDHLAFNFGAEITHCLYVPIAKINSGSMHHSN